MLAGCHLFKSPAIAGLQNVFHNVYFVYLVTILIAIKILFVKYLRNNIFWFNFRNVVIPEIRNRPLARRGIHSYYEKQLFWIPAFAGMTTKSGQ